MRKIAIAITAFVLITASANAEFSDIQGHQYATAIKYLNSNNMISGYSEGTFKPDNQINRAELL